MGVDRLCEDLLLLAIDAGKGSLGRAFAMAYGLMGAELVLLAARGRIDIIDDQIVVKSAAPTGDPDLDAALAALGETASPPRPADWVARPRLHICGSYLERLTAAGVIEPETRFWARRWRITDAVRLAEARHRADTIAASTGPVDLSQAAYAGLACAIGLDRLLYRSRGRRPERDRLRQVAAGRWTASSATPGEPTDPTQAAGQAVAQGVGSAAAAAAIYAVTQASVAAAASAVAMAASSAGGHGAGGHGGH
jgi:Golgi phosphoprotein 3 (GPP34)